MLSADRPPELRGIGAGQTIDQIKLYGASVRWFCEVGTHAADDDGLLHYRSVACRALAAARGETAPRARSTSTCPGASRWRRSPVEGAVTATDPLALEGRDGRPLTAVTPIDLEPSAFLLEEIAGHIGDAIAGVIVAGRQLDPELREPLAHLARVAGFPILAEPTSQLRCGPHDRSHVVAAYDLLLRDERFARSVVPDLVLRFGEMPTSKPLRTWLAACGADQIVVDPTAAGTSRPPRRRDPARRPDRAGGGLGGAAGARNRARRRAPWLDAERRRAKRDRRGAGRPSSEITEPALHLALGHAHARRRPRLHRLEHADPRPGGVPRRRRRPTPSSSATAAPTASTACSPPGIGAAHASGRPTTIVTGDLGLLHDIGGLAALRDVSTPVRIVVIDNDGGGIFHFLPQAKALGGEEFEALLGTPRGVDVAQGRRAFRPPPPPARVPRGAPASTRRRHRPDRGQGRPPGQRRPASPPRHSGPNGARHNFVTVSLLRHLPRYLPAGGRTEARSAGDRPGLTAETGLPDGAEEGAPGTESIFVGQVPSALISITASPNPKIARSVKGRASLTNAKRCPEGSQLGDCSIAPV